MGELATYSPSSKQKIRLENVSSANDGETKREENEDVIRMKTVQMLMKMNSAM